MSSRQQPQNAGRIEGIITALVTPFTKGELDERVLSEHALRVLKGGSSGILVGGTSGEYTALSRAERQRAIEVAVDVSAGKHVMAGICETSTDAAIEMAIIARKAGATSVLVTPPFFTNPSLPGLVEHFRAVAGAADVPVTIYNNPGRTGMNFDVAILEPLMSVEGIVAMKDCDRDVSRISEKIRTFGDRLSLLSGDDDLGWQTLVCGANGGVWATGNLMPTLPSQVLDAVRYSNVPRGRQLHHIMSQLCAAWFTAGHPASLKCGVDWKYALSTGLRKPLVAPDSRAAAGIAAAITEAEDALRALEVRA